MGMSPPLSGQSRSAATAFFAASPSVGWMCTASSMVSAVAPAFISSTKSCTTSDPESHSAAAPSMRRLPASATTLMKPRVRPISRALPLSLMGWRPTRTRWPAFRAWASVMPTRPSSGSVNTA